MNRVLTHVCSFDARAISPADRLCQRDNMDTRNAIDSPLGKQPLYPIKQDWHWQAAIDPDRMVADLSF
jgi:hypothetical protein